MTIDTITTWHRLVAQHDASGLDDLLAEEPTFYSPVVHTPQVGKEITKQYLTAAFAVFFNESFRYVREIVGTQDAMLEFELELDGIHINGVDLISWDASGRITEFKVLLRPLKGVNIIHQKMAKMLADAANTR